MKKIAIAFLLLPFLLPQLDAQSRKVYEQAAEQAMANKDYSAALGYYDILIDQAEYEDVENYYRAGEAAYNFKLFQRSERYFQLAIDNGGREEYSTLDFQMAMTKKRIGKYAEAQELFEKYLKEHSGNTNGFPERAAAEIETCEWAQGVVANPELNIHAPVAVTDTDTIKHLDTTVNTRYTDLAPLSRGETFYYSSIRYFAGEEEAPFARILSSENGELAQPVSGWGGGDKSIAHTAFNTTGDRVYFTICDTLGLAEYRCKIYYRDREGDNSWGDAMALPETVNANNATATQPTVGTDRATGEELLFFVSDREGGQGALDVWCSLIVDGKVGAPYNVKSVNTAGNDITPYFYGKKSTLYWSSDARQSLGGFDVYKTIREKGQWTAPEHTGYPLNSSYDDVYLSLNEKGDAAYFSSNRPGGICKDTAALECICDDIYSVEIPYIDLIVETYNKITKEELTETVVSVKPKDAPANTQGPTSNYQYFYEIEFNEAYEVVGSKPDYLGDELDFDTYEVQESGTLVKKLYLTPAIDVLGRIYNKRTGEPLVGASLNLVDAPTVEGLETKQGAQEYKHLFDLNFKRRYLLIASKPGYSSDTVEVFTDNIPIVPTHLERDLFLCRKPLVDQPQIVLFFDNDIPKKLPSNHARTNSNYQTTFDNYVEETKMEEYLNAFDLPEEKQKVSDFFAEVNENFGRLESFAADLHDYMSDGTIDAGDTIVITIRGYASPLAKPAYNELLTQRRIYSIEKYLAEYRNGSLKPYLSRVKFNRVPYGEREAKGGSEDRRDKKASIYSIDASRERRVEIINISNIRELCPDTNPERKDQ